MVVFSRGFPSLSPNLRNKFQTIAVLSRHNVISQQLHSGAIRLTLVALLRFMLLLDQNQTPYFTRADKQCWLYQARGAQTTVILERNYNKCVNCPYIKQKCQCPTFVLYDHGRGTKQQKVDIYQVFSSLPPDPGF